MTETQTAAAETQSETQPIGVDRVAVAYILGGIPAIVGFIVLLFALVQLNENIPA